MKRIAILLLTLVLAVSMASCGKSGSPIPSEPSGEASSAGAPDSNLRLLQIGTEAGRYGTAYEEDHTILCYIDYANACDTALCNQPACTHDSDSCTAFIPDGVIVSGIYALDESTMAFILTDENNGATLYLADSDGGNRRKLYQANSGEEFWELTCADNQYLYFFLYRTGSDGNTTNQFCRLSLSGGEPEPVIENLDSQILGVYGRNLVCYRYEYEEPENLQEPEVPEGATEEEANRIMMEYLGAFKGTHEVYLLNLDDGSRTDLDSWSSTMGNEGRLQLVDQDRLYWCESSWNQLPDAIHWISTEGESGETALSWPEDLKQAVESVSYGMAGLERMERKMGDWLLIYVQGPWNGMRRYAVNTQDGSVQEISLRYQSNGKDQPITILGQSQDSYLVEIETQLKEVTFIQQDGTPSTNWAGVGRFGLITFEDFLAGNPQYREINTQYLESIW